MKTCFEKIFAMPFLDKQISTRIVRPPMKKQHDNLFAFVPGNEPRDYLCASQPRGIRMAWINEAAMN
jgi:hypothetical protein